MAKRKGRGLKTFIVLILVIGILAGAGYCAWRFLLKDNIDKIFPTEKADTFMIEVNGKSYRNGSSGLLLLSGQEVIVTTPKNQEYEIKIYANNAKDFTYFLGAEPWAWSNVKGVEFTKGFQITRTEAGFKIEYESLYGIIGKVQEQQVTISDEEDISGDIFELEITSGKETLKVYFGVGVPVTGLEMQPNLTLTIIPTANPFN